MDVVKGRNTGGSAKGVNKIAINARPPLCRHVWGVLFLKASLGLLVLICFLLFFDFVFVFSGGFFRMCGGGGGRGG